MVEVPVAVDRTFELAASPDEAWALLADVPRWGRLYPHVDAVRPVPDAGPDVYRWTMAPLGPPGGRVRIVYACRYHREPDTRALTWTPVAGVGNATFEGEARLTAAGTGTAGRLRLAAVLQIPAPSWVRGVVVPAVQHEMARMTDTFLDRLARVGE